MHQLALFSPQTAGMQGATADVSIKPPPPPPRSQSSVFAPSPHPRPSSPSSPSSLSQDSRSAHEFSPFPSQITSSRRPSQPHLRHLLSESLSSCGLNEQACYEYYLASPAFIRDFAKLQSTGVVYLWDESSRLWVEAQVEAVAVSYYDHVREVLKGLVEETSSKYAPSRPSKRQVKSSYCLSGPAFPDELRVTFPRFIFLN